VGSIIDLRGTRTQEEEYGQRGRGGEERRERRNEEGRSMRREDQPRGKRRERQSNWTYHSWHLVKNPTMV
jgi:hypothetical protein